MIKWTEKTNNKQSLGDSETTYVCNPIKGN